jgi:hypothetical protein
MPGKTGGRLYVFEAPIDLLSFISLHQQDWRTHSYVALCGVAEHAMLKTLELHPQLREVSLCLDHDETGIEAAGRLAGILAERGYNQVSLLQPTHKDWNEDIKAGYGLDALPAMEHPQLVLCPEVCGRIAGLMAQLPKNAALERRLPNLFQSFKHKINIGRLEKAFECLEDMAAFSLDAAAREYRQVGKDLSTGELAVMLQDSFKPHQNRGSMQNRISELSHTLQAALSQQQAGGIRSGDQKQKLAEAWMAMALGCVKVIICARAGEMKQEQKRAHSLNPVMTMA